MQPNRSVSTWWVCCGTYEWCYSKARGMCADCWLRWRWKHKTHFEGKWQQPSVIFGNLQLTVRTCMIRKPVDSSGSWFPQNLGNDVRNATTGLVPSNPKTKLITSLNVSVGIEVLYFGKTWNERLFLPKATLENLYAKVWVKKRLREPDGYSPEQTSFRLPVGSIWWIAVDFKS